MNHDESLECLTVSKETKDFLDLFIDAGFCKDYDKVLRAIFAHCTDLFDAEHGFVGDLMGDPENSHSDIDMAFTVITNDVAVQMQSLTPDLRRAYERFFAYEGE